MFSTQGSRPKAIMLDLGGTLVDYYERHEFPGVLREALERVLKHLVGRGIVPGEDRSWVERVNPENHEAHDCAVRPLEDRLARVFDLHGLESNPILLEEICREFMGPIFGRATVFDDAKPALKSLGRAGCRMLIVSNTPWGSPSWLWREEVKRYGLDSLVEGALFCRDVGFRKPARQIFEEGLRRLGSAPEEAIFVGDDPRWDVVGPERCGIKAILLDRRGTAETAEVPVIRSLAELGTDR